MSAFAQRQQQAITALLSSTSVAQAARACGLTERTLRRYLDSPPFREQVQAARREAYGLAVGRLGSISCEAVETLASLMRDTAVAAGVRCRCAVAILDAAGSGLELSDVAEKVEDLLARLERLAHET
ncbi:MAG: hypothetical protein KBE04_11680 [Phycisphaerae bacterium]|nr:hypothetical protein [Phycisphaerae bacterium]